MRNLANNMKGENKMMCCCCCMSGHLNTVYFSYTLCAPENENLKEQKKDVDFSGRYCMDAVPAIFIYRELTKNGCYGKSRHYTPKKQRITSD